MKKALLKKRYGIPAALLLVLLLSGTALAWYAFNTIDSTTTVEEPLETTETKDFDATMSPGETNTWKFDITNSADVAYSIKADISYSAPSGVSVTDFILQYFDENDDKCGNSNNAWVLEEKDSYMFPYDIPANGYITCTITISAAKDATPGDVSVSLAISRGQKSQ